MYQGYQFLKIVICLKFLNINFIQKWLFNASLMNKKENLKNDLYTFTKDLYVYMTFKVISEEERKLLDIYVDSYQGVNKHDLPTKGVTEKELNSFEKKLYIRYLNIINRALYLNEETVNLTKLEYFLNIQLDILDSNKNYPLISFIYQNDIKHIEKLKKILYLVYEYSKNDDYFTFGEFQSFLYSYRESFHIVDIDIFKNLNKIPKRLKRRTYVNKR